MKKRTRTRMMGYTVSMITACGILQSSISYADFWERTHGPTGGIVRVITIGASGSLFVGSENGGLHRSSNSGDSWTEPAALTGVGVLSIANGIEDFLFAGSPSAGVFRSSDQGISWTRDTLGIGARGVTAIGVTSTGTVFAGVEPGNAVFRSTDNGQSWHQSSLSAGSGQPIEAIVTNALDHIFVLKNSRLFRSTNDGETWTEHVNGGGACITVSTNGYLFVGRASHGVPNVYRSTDNGDSWIPMSNGLDNNDPVRSITAFAAQEVLCGTSRGRIYKTTNAGAVWTLYTYPLDNSKPILAISKGTGQWLFVGTEGRGFFSSTDNGTNWLESNDGLVATSIKTLCISPNTVLFAGTEKSGLHLSNDNGLTWHSVNYNPFRRNPVDYVASDDFGRVYVAGQGGMHRSTDDGTSWTEFGSFPLYKPRAITLDSAGFIFAGTDYGGVYRSQLDSAAWIETNLGLTSMIVSTLVTTPVGHIFAGTAAGVFRSTNSGAGWVSANAGLPNSTYVTSLSVSPFGNIFASLAGQVYRSTNNGTTWIPISSGLPNQEQRALACNKAGYLFVATSQGIFQSLDEGLSWSAVSSGLTNGSILSLALDGGGFLYGGSDGSGVYRTLDSTTSPMLEITVSVDESWNLVSVPVTRDNLLVASVFPSAFSPAYFFTSTVGYQATDTLEHGLGYWLKFGSAHTLTINGLMRTSDTLNINQGWNLISSISRSVVVDSVIQAPPGIVISDFFGFVGSYVAAQFLRPGKGYWVKSSQDGQLILR